MNVCICVSYLGSISRRVTPAEGFTGGRRKLASDHRRRFKRSIGLSDGSKALKPRYEASVCLRPVLTLLGLAVGFEKKREGLEPSAQDLSHISNTSWPAGDPQSYGKLYLDVKRG